MPRPRAWVDRIITRTQGSVNQVDDLLAAATVNLDTITVTRLLISLHVTPDVVTSNVSWGQRLDMGIGVVTGAAFDAGQASIPDPRVQSDAPARGWLWRASMAASWENLNALETGPYVWPTQMWDIGAMRKVDRGKLVIVYAKTAFRGTESDVNIEGLIRVLCLT